MRIMERNKTAFYYCLYAGETQNLDENGYETGEKTVKYSPAVKIRANISPATGSAQVEQFGNLASYDKVIVTDDVNCPIDENTVLFIDRPPTFKDGLPQYDYTVWRVARSLNSVSIAVRRVQT